MPVYCLANKSCVCQHLYFNGVSSFLIPEKSFSYQAQARAQLKLHSNEMLESGFKNSRGLKRNSTVHFIKGHFRIRSENAFTIRNIKHLTSEQHGRKTFCCLQQCRDVTYALSACPFSLLVSFKKSDQRVDTKHRQ